MRECPFCKAEIEDNARFCLYCMKPLVEKEVVSPTKGNRRLIWLLPILTVFLIFGILAAVLLMGNSQNDLPMADTTVPTRSTDTEDSSAPAETGSPTATAPTQGTEPPAEDDPTQETKPPVEDDPTPPATEPTPCTHKYLLQTEEKPTCTQGGVRRFVCSACGDVKLENTPASGHQFQDATCLLPKTCKICQLTAGDALGHSYSDNICTHCGDRQNTTPDPSIRFEYHLAEAEDLGLSDYDNVNNEIVITGVRGESPTGEYVIPSYIDGMRVRAIMPDAFLASNAKTVIIGSAIELIWDYAFAECEALTDVYFAGEYLDLRDDAFPRRPLEEKLTFHCSATCRNADRILYKNWSGVRWEEWDGEL